jgi:chromosome partitioning protein
VNKIFLIKNNKGGVGKSFLTSQLAHGLSLLDKKVLILTSDSQNNIFDFFTSNMPSYDGGLKTWITKGEGDLIRLRENVYFIPLEESSFGNLKEKFNIFIEKMKKEYDYILIDSVPTMKIDEMFISVADKFIIPTIADKVTSRMLLEYLEEIELDKVHSIVINKFIATKIQLEWKEFLEKNLTGKINLFSIKQLSEIEKLIEKGKTIFETESYLLKETQKNIIQIVKNIIGEEK